jgi:serine/threonine-protein kinase
MKCLSCLTENPDGARFCNACGAALGNPALPPGTILQGRYLIERVMHPGNMSTVYGARDENVAGQSCAIKELQDAYLPAQLRPDAARRFMKEAEILSKLRHPNIPFIKDFFTEQGRYYIVMELMEGENLEQHLTAQGRRGFSEKDVLAWVVEICGILHYLHSLNPPVIHRDIKPANLVRGSDGRIFLIDFGIARIFAPQQKGTLIGTPGYAAPEQYKGETSEASDLYSLGITIYELLTGVDPQQEVPFNLPDLQRRRPDLSSFTVALLEQLLRLNPHERPSGALQVQKMLSDALSIREPSPQTPLQKSPAAPSILRRAPTTLVHAKDRAEMILIPAGYFWMGESDEVGDEDQVPRHERFIENFYIDRFQVTNAQFARFIEASGYKAEGSWRRLYLKGMERFPVVGVTFNDAAAYCTWSGKSLPSEAQWEKTARGGDGRIFPWGDKEDELRCNNAQMKKPTFTGKMADFGDRRGTLPVGSFPEGRTPQGVDDMAGNVWEWTDSWYEPYPGNTFRIDDFGKGYRVLRGGSWGDGLMKCRSFVRAHEDPSVWSDVTGFRTVLNIG